MHLYRLTRQKYADDISGEGAKIYGGRWNKKGTVMVYTATARSLAILEMLVHTDKRFIPKDLVMVTIEIDSQWVEVASSLPKKWREVPTPVQSQKWGSVWLAKDVCGVYVPSVLVPEENNVLLNPSCPLFSNKCLIIDVKAFSFDVRLI